MTGGIIAGTMIAGDMTGGTVAVITVADATVRVARDTHSGINTTISEVKTHVGTQDLWRLARHSSRSRMAGAERERSGRGVGGIHYGSRTGSD
jgi:hypothetical protein